MRLCERVRVKRIRLSARKVELACWIQIPTEAAAFTLAQIPLENMNVFF